ncbi:MAG: hypothetical protein ACERKV_12530 [Clostridiaceae bacterium]
MILTLEIIGIIFMVTFIFISIWCFILLTKIFEQIKYENYLMEKLNEHISLLSNKKD